MAFAIIHVSLLISLCCYCHPGPFMHHHFPLCSSWLHSCPIPSPFQRAAASSISPLTCSSVTVKEKSYICTLSHETAWLISWQAGILWLWCRRTAPEPSRNDVIHYCNDASGWRIITWELYMPLWSVTGLFLLRFLCLASDWVGDLTAHTHILYIYLVFTSIPCDAVKCADLTSGCHSKWDAHGFEKSRL